MRTSESIKEIAKVLPLAQSGIKSAKKDVDNTFFKSKYADLASVIDACKEALNANGISFLQYVRSTESGVVVETMLLHTSGEWISEELALPVSKNDAQGIGSAISYGKRYGLQAMVGVPSEDDDGNKAASAAPAKKLGSSARDATVEALAAFPPDQQKFIHAEAAKIQEASKTMNAEDLHAFVEVQHYDSEEKMALWSLLPSDVRSKIKSRRATPQELATQP